MFWLGVLAGWGVLFLFNFGMAVYNQRNSDISTNASLAMKELREKTEASRELLSDAEFNQIVEQSERVSKQGHYAIYRRQIMSETISKLRTAGYRVKFRENDYSSGEWMVSWV